MGYGDRSRSPRGREPPREKISVLVRNLPLDTRPDEIRDMFEQFGRVRDVYLPKDYYSGRPKGFGFVEFLDERDAQDAIYELDGKRFGGRELNVCRSREGRKNPDEMRSRGRHGDGGRRRRSRSRSRSRDRSRDRNRRRRSPSRSRSPPHGRSRSRSPARRGDSPPARSRSKSPPHNDAHDGDNDDDRE